MTWLAALMLAVSVGGSSEVGYLDVSLDLPGQLLDWRAVDVDGDGVLEFVLAVRTKEGERALHLHHTSDTRIDPVPYDEIPVFEGVLAYGFADVRDEPGQEILFLTRTGVHSYSPTKQGFRDNARRLLSADLIYDVPSPRALPYWSYSMPASGGDWVIVPVRGALEIWGPPDEQHPADPQTGDYRRVSRISAPEGHFRESSRSRARRRARDVEESRRGLEVEVNIDRDLGPFFPGAILTGGPPPVGDLVSDSRSVPAPAMTDVNGDDHIDLVMWQRKKLSVYLGDGRGFPPTPSRIEELPEYLDKEGFDLSLELVDLDGDGDPDLLAELSEDEDGFENSEISLFLLLNDGERLFPEQPRQLLRFEAGMLLSDVVDVNGDGRPDLFVRKFELPALIGAVTGLEFHLSHLLYLATDDGGRLLDRKPAMKHERAYDENTVIEAVANRDVSMDCDGDGVPDMIEVDLQGRIAIRRLKYESGFLRGKAWVLDESPWKRFEPQGDILALEVLDLNGDGLGDVVSHGDRQLIVLMSTVRGRRSGR